MSTVVFILYAGIVAFASLRPGIDGGIEHLDKVTHLLVYYIFAVLGYRALKARSYYLYVCLGIIAYGGLLEVVQSHLPDVRPDDDHGYRSYFAEFLWALRNQGVRPIIEASSGRGKA